MNATLTITAKGQITLPKEILAHLGARPGDRLVVEMLKGGRLQIQPKRTKAAASIVGLLARPDQKRLSIREVRDESAAGWAGER
ncbi:MAG: AbrB/MazE/SpoVT family DNA-binding domain-containing protein [Gammaproteobacteria bacterium]|nr:AbrB/MazE/SpoVT family DNA-binding domain-containing protein [Gammaproteobacteria bacterium]